MAARVVFTSGFSRRYTGGVREFTVEAKNLRGVIKEMDRRYPGLGLHLEEETTVAIDGQSTKPPISSRSARAAKSSSSPNSKGDDSPMISALDTHETVKRLTAAGFTDAQAEALTAAVKEAVEIDLSNIATKTDIADVRREMADMKAELVKWVVGVGFAQVATIIAVLKLFPPSHP